MTYYEHVRNEIQPLLPESALRILDIGSGAGATLKWLKSIYPNAETTGVEINSALHDDLKKNADVAIIGNVDDCFSQLQSYDLIILLDVLEHLFDPVSTLRKLSTRLEVGGYVIASVPNIAHLSVSIPLLLKRRFNYSNAGILDRTHLRFFVEKTAIELLNSANLLVTKGIMSGFSGSKSYLLDHLSFGLLQHHLAKQYIMRAEVSHGEIFQETIHWMKE